MTQKDYIRIAAALRYVRPSNPVCSPKLVKVTLAAQTAQWNATVAEIADTLARERAQFDRDKFMAAVNA